MGDWLIFTDEGDFDTMVAAPDEATALDEARAAGCEGDLTAEPVTPEMRRNWRNERRRERYAERRDAGEIKSRGRGNPPGFVFDLSFGASMAIHDSETGRCRCPNCGRYSIPADFANAPTSMRFRTPTGVACVTFGPSCWRCRGMERAPYDLPPEAAQ